MCKIHDGNKDPRQTHRGGTSALRPQRHREYHHERHRIASEKGRRTIYTYFKNKRDIYNAVIERESDHLVSRLEEVASLDLPPMELLERYLNVRFDLIINSFQRHDTVRSLFGRDIKRIARMRKMALAKEQHIFRNILAKGVAEGAFNPVQAHSS